MFKPDTVFALLAAGIGLAAMAVAKARVDTQPDRVTAGRLPLQAPTSADLAKTYAVEA